MRFEIPLRTGFMKVAVSALLLSGFALIVDRAESTFFADRLSRIPLFGTELAAKGEPDDPQYEFQLGNYWIIAAHQPEAALPHFKRATELDPYNGRYWGQEALAYQQLGDSAQANAAIGHSLAADPNTPELLWQAANVYSYLGEKQSALNSIRQYVMAMPEQSPMAAQLGWRISHNERELLDTVMPKGWVSDLSLLIALVRFEDPEASARLQPLDKDPNDYFVHNLVAMAVPEPSDGSTPVTTIDLAAEKEKARVSMLRIIDMKTGHDWSKTEAQLAAEHQARVQQAYEQKQQEKRDKTRDDSDVFQASVSVWRRLMQEPTSFDTRLALPYLQMLIDADLNAEAQDAWRLLVSHEPRLRSWSSDKNLIQNGSFEYEVLNGGFDWQYTVNNAVDLALDHRNAKDGGSSLRMRFTDKPLADVGVVQYVPVKPNTDYEFTGYLKTDSVEAATGLRFRVQDTDAMDPYWESSDVKGTTGWTKLSGRFRTTASSHFVAVRLVRNPGNTLINGQAWADAINLGEIGAR